MWGERERGAESVPQLLRLRDLTAKMPKTIMHGCFIGPHTVNIDLLKLSKINSYLQ